MSQEPLEQPQPTTAPEDAKSKRATNLWTIGIGAAIVAVIAFFATRTTHHDATPDEQKADAGRACQEKFIPERLKAPASAKFSSVATTFDGTSYHVEGLVDSQNSFGALVRSSFTCVMHSSGSQWVLDSANVKE
jgi:hypothetical protein